MTVLRSGGKEVRPVAGIKRSAWRADDKQDKKGLASDCGSRLIPVEDYGKPGWRQETLYLYDSLSPKLTQFLRRLGLDRDEMDDVIQESFLRLAGHLRESRSGDENLSSWVYQVARNLAMDLHRSNRREHEEIELEFETKDEPIDPKADPEWVYLQKERARRVRVAMSQLTAQQYNSVLLRTQGMRYREIARLLGISEQRAIRLVKRALQKLMGGL